jgi:Fe-S cluster assembly protein SufB
LPTKIRDTFEKLKIPRIEAEQLSGINNQYDSSPVYHALMKELADQHVLFCSMDEAVSKHPEIVKKYFGKLVPFTDNKYAALNSAV